MKLSDLQFKNGYRMSREEFTRYNVYCPHCEAYVEEPVYDYEQALLLMYSHTKREGHSPTTGEYDVKKT